MATAGTIAITNENPEGLVTESGALSQILPGFDLDSICGVSKLIADRKTIAQWAEEKFIAAEFVMYTVEDNEAAVYIGKKHNPIFNNIKGAASQLESSVATLKHGEGGYIPSPEEIETARKASTTLRVKISDLMLHIEKGVVQEQRMKEKGSRHTLYYFDIPTKGYEKLNSAQAAFAVMALPQLDKLNDEGFRILRVYVSSPESIRKRVKEGSAIVRPVTLSLGGSNYVIPIHIDYQDLRYGHKVYGRKLPPGNEVFIHAYDTILASPTAALKAMTPPVAGGLSSLLDRYHAQKK